MKKQTDGEGMRIGAYQFKVTGSIEDNLIHIQEGVEKASGAGVRLLVFPECAVTGYPPHCIRSAHDVQDDAVRSAHRRLQALSQKHLMHLAVGTITEDGGKRYNSAVLFRPDGEGMVYAKRALWGWDRENFAQGQNIGVTEADSFKIGIRICFEVRFPEYFRELYREKTDLNLILFYDVSEREDPDRLRLIKGHLQTRAVENVCYTLSCNTCAPFQTAPTALFDRSGKILAELEGGKEGLLVYDLEKTPLTFGEAGRKEISDSIVK